MASGSSRSGQTRGVVSAMNARAEVAVAGDRSGLDQRLEFPRPRPPVVVGRVALERAGERPRPPFGPQVGVGAEHDAVLARRRHRARAARARGALGRVGVAVVDEQHVDVARVVQLAAAELAHADHREAAPSGSTIASAASRHTSASAASSRPTAGHVGDRRAGRAPRCGAARAASSGGAPRASWLAAPRTTTRGTTSTVRSRAKSSGSRSGSSSDGIGDDRGRRASARRTRAR